MRKKEVDEILEKWKSECLRKGLSGIELQAYLDYIRNLIKQDLPPIVDLKHLSLLMGIDYVHIAIVVNATSIFYREFEIPKRAGGFRKITTPYPSLKYMQTWIYDNILAHRKTHFCANGFVHGRSILTNAQIHENCKMLLKMDISDFFGSIPQNFVINYFHKELGYNLNVSWILSSICTLNGSLPQGAPTSPVLSNLISTSLDRRLYRLSKHFGFTYSRYADDLAFSGNDIPVTFIRYVEDIVNDCKLRINQSKTRLYGQGGSKIIAGISLATGKPRVPREYRHNLRQELHYIRKYGLEGHMKHNKIRRANYPVSLLGKINFWLYIEPENIFAKEMRAMLMHEISILSKKEI